jgi:hypothetical protein
MPDRLFLTRLFLVTGAVLAFIGLILWSTLPIRPMFPPYVVTAALALIYGAVCKWGRLADARKS